MILGRALTAQERKVSQWNYNAFSLINGASYMCLGENVIILYAVHLAAPNSLIALIGSMIYLGYLVMPLGVMRTAKVGAAACQADFWVCRNVVALLIASAAFVAKFSSVAAWCMVIIGSFLFYGCRAAGCVLSMPLVGDIATKEEVAPLVGENNKRFYTSGVVILAVVSALLFKFESVWTLVGVIVFGAICGVVASKYCRNIMETGLVRDAARGNIVKGMLDSFKNVDMVKLCVAWFGLNLVYILVVPMSVLALKRGCGFTDTTALVCAALMFLSGAFVSAPAGKLCKHVGPRAVLKCLYFVYLAVPFVWLLFPAGGMKSLSVWLIAIVMFLAEGIVYIGSNISITGYFLMIFPDKEVQVPYSISNQLVVSVGAGLVGSLVSSGLISLAERLAPHCGQIFSGPLGSFRLYFVMIIPVVVAVFVGILRLRVVISEFRRKHGIHALEHVFHISH